MTERGLLFDWETLRLSLRRLRHDIEIADLTLKDAEDPEVIVAGIEGRAIVRAGLRQYL